MKVVLAIRSSCCTLRKTKAMSSLTVLPDEYCLSELMAASVNVTR